MIRKLKPYLITALVVVITVAILNRLAAKSPALKSAVTGS